MGESGPGARRLTLSELSSEEVRSKRAMPENCRTWAESPGFQFIVLSPAREMYQPREVMP